MRPHKCVRGLTLVESYHKKVFSGPPYDEYTLANDEARVLLDPEAHAEYENVNPGTVTCHGYAIDVWEHEINTNEKFQSYNIMVSAQNPPSLTGNRILRRLSELQSSKEPLGRDPLKDYEDLAEFTGNFGYSISSLKYKSRFESLSMN
jgi:hypothetical protein